MKRVTSLISTFILFALTACGDQAEVKLNLVTLENEEIRVEKYQISRLTSIHQLVDITDKRCNKVKRVVEADDGAIDSVFIKQDTLFLRKGSSQPVIYDLAAIKFGHKIALLAPKSN